MKIKLKTSWNEKNKIFYYTTFEVLDEWEARRLKRETWADAQKGYAKVIPINLDIEERNEIRLTHYFHKLKNEIEDTVRYIAVPQYINISIEKYSINMVIILETFEGENRFEIELDKGFDIEDYLDEILEYFGYLSDDFIKVIKMALGTYGYDFF